MDVWAEYDWLMSERIKNFASEGLIGEAPLREISGLQPALSPLGDLNWRREAINKEGVEWLRKNQEFKKF